MDKEEAAEWADALDSGRFEQCRGELRYNNNFCCLGVKSFLDNGDKVALPYPHYAMSSYDVGFFIVLNDRFKYDFPQIADIIRQRYQVDA